MLLKERLEDLYMLLEEMTLTVRRDPAFEPSPFERWTERILVALYVASLLILVGLAFWYRLVRGGPPREHTIAIDFFYLASLALPVFYVIVMTFGAVKIVWKHRRKRFPAILAALKSDLLNDAEFLVQLSRFDRPMLQYALVQYRHRWDSFDGRMGLLAGDLRKVGLMPALTTASIAASTLLKDGSVSLLWAPLIVTCCFYVLCFFATAKRERPQQVIQLLEYAIERAKEVNPAKRMESSPMLYRNISPTWSYRTPLAPCRRQRLVEPTCSPLDTKW